MLEVDNKINVKITSNVITVQKGLLAYQKNLSTYPLIAECRRVGQLSIVL